MSYLPISGWKNKKGTSDRSCACGSWKEHWKNETGLAWPTKCSVSNCNNSPVLGAHIYNISETVTNEYIAPLCDSCNKLEKEFSLKNSLTLAFANQNKSCKK